MASSARTATARGLGVRPPATGGATRRAISDAVGRAAWRGAGLGRARRGARGGFAGPASAGEPEARRRPAKGKNPFSKYIFKEFLNAIFQILFLSKKMTSFENEPKMKIA